MWGKTIPVRTLAGQQVQLALLPRQALPALGALRRCSRSSCRQQLQRRLLAHGGAGLRSQRCGDAPKLRRRGSAWGRYVLYQKVWHQRSRCSHKERQHNILARGLAEPA